MSAALVRPIMFDRSVLSSEDAAAIRSALEALLTECQGNVTLASRQAGVERQSMHRLLNRYRLQAKDYRPKGGGSIIARAALKNLAAAAPAPVRTYGGRDFTRTAIREVEARRPAYVAPALPATNERFDQSDVVERPYEARGYAPHHRPAYQSDLGHAALHALSHRKVAGS
jgi:hypothetical protein